MITDPETFEAALQRAADFMEHPPAGRAEGELEFDALLHDIEQYRPELPVTQPDTNFVHLAKAADALMARADDFQKRREARDHDERLMSFPDDGHGIGPTTGV